MTRVFFMRHGNTFEKNQTPIQIGARTDLALTEFGKEQARAMGKYLEDKNIIAIYTGPLKRQRESASLIGQILHCPMIEEPALTEIDYGLWEGLTAQEIERRWPQEYSQWAEGKWQPHIFGSTYEKHRDALFTWLKNLRQGAYLAVTSNGLLRLLGQKKVNTGCFCEIELHRGNLGIRQWNMLPLDASAS